MDPTNDLWFQIGITPAGALGVVIAATVIYIVFTAVIVVWWRHLHTANSAFAFALTVVLGGVMGRSMLGESPTLAGGLVAVATLLVLEFGFNRVRRSGGILPGARRVTGAVVMVGRQVDSRELRRLGVEEHELWVLLRRSGLRHADQIGAVIVERDGRLSILRAGTKVDRRILTGVRGLDRLPASLLED